MDMTLSQKVLLSDSKDLPLHKPEENRKPEVNDICVSHFTTGQKEALRAALKQRSQNTFVSKEVKVQLLEDVSRERPESSALEKGHTQTVLDSAAAVAAVTAATIASSAPFFKAQNELEAKINSFSGLLSKLEERDKLLQHIAEQQTHTQTPGLERPHYRDRIIELEKQLNQLTEQRLQHLEKLQQQQLDIQSHFLSSTVNTGSYQAISGPASYTTKQNQPQILPSNSTTTSVCPRDFTAVSAPATHACIPHPEVSSGKSPLETPAPRRFAPIPMAKDGRVSQKEIPVAGKENVNESRRTVNLEKGRFLEQILRGQETPVNHRAEKAPVSKTKLGKKDSLHSSEPVATFEGPLPEVKPVGSSSISAMQKADDVLHDLGQLKKEVQNMLQTKEPVKLSALGNADHISKPSLLQTTKAPKSMFEDAERILRDVQNSKKILEENLEAIIRAKDGGVMYSLISALSTNRDVAEEVRIQKTVDSWITAMSMEIQDELARKDFENRNSNQKDHVSSVMRKAQNTKGIKIKQERKDQQPPKKTGLVARKPFSRDTSRETSARQLSVRRESQFHPGHKKDERSKVPLPTPEGALSSEEFLSQVYGKAIYQGHRRTLKKGPYLRVNSPSPKSKLQRPKVIEYVKGVKVKSARTQTGSFPQQMKGSSPPRPYPLTAPFEQDLQYLFSPSKSSMSGPLEGHLIPMAIPLGRSRFDGAAPQPAAVLLTRPQPITVITSIPSSAPKPQPTVNKPNVAVIEMKSEKKETPNLSVQVLPNVDIDSVVSDSTSLSERSPSPVKTLPPPSAEAVIQTPEPVEPEEEYAEFPGTNFIDVTDIAQDQEKEDEIPEPVLELNGWSEPVSAQYSGLPFPPTVPAAQPTTDILDGIITRRETLENRLINWVEQEIMAQIISRMYLVQPETLPNTDIAESEESAASDIVETAGGGGLQLFVSAGVPVDSDLIRRYVNEALAETIEILLGEREVQKGVPAPRVPESVPNVQATVIHTPVVTPQPTPLHSPPPSLKEPALVKTPVLSPQNSEAESDGSQKISPVIGFKIPEAASPVVTPTTTPVASPPRVATPSPHVFEHIPEKTKMLSPKHINPWEDAELPLEEENPNSSNEETPFPRAVVISVAREEEAESLISRASPEPERSLVSVSPEPQTPSPVPSPSSSSSRESTSSTDTVTETDTADRPISEGEVLYSFGQMVVARALAEEGLAFDQIRDSLSSTLQDTNEMEFDPPSEGQVVKRPHKGYHKDPVLSLMAQLQQAPFAAQEVVCHPESSEDDKSVGELSEGQRPRLTTAAESILVGHSIYMSEPSPVELRSRRIVSPGHFDRLPGVDLRDSAASRGPMSIGELELQPVTVQQPTQINAFRSKPTAVEGPSKKHQMLLVESKPVPTRSIQVGMEAEILQQSGSRGDLDRTVIEPNAYLHSLLSGAPAEPNIRSLPAPGKMTVTLPSVNTEKHAGNIDRICDDTDSSGADTF